MTAPRVSALLRHGRALFLRYDAGLERGVAQFDEKTVDPEYAMNIALEGNYSGIIVHQGIAQKYHRGAFKEIPLIVRIDSAGEQLCTVGGALKLGASAIATALWQTDRRGFSHILEEAHDHGLPIVGIMERCEDVPGAARMALELGVDLVMVPFQDDPHRLAWVARCAGRARLILMGTEKERLLREANGVNELDAMGFAVGEEVWRDERPFSLSRALEEVVYRKRTPEQARHWLH